MAGPLSTVDDLRLICKTGVAEGLQLEFKLKEDHATGALSKADKRAIAEAVSSFENSDGGTLVYGVRSKRTSGADVAEALIPIQEISRFAAEFRMVCSLNISPELRGVTVDVLTESDGTSGYVVCNVPRSDRRPHMSTAPGVHSYYRRSFDGSALMTPSEITDQILAVREAVLRPTIRIAEGGSLSNMGYWVSVGFGVHFGVENIGTRTCKNPFLRVRCNQSTSSHGATFDSRLGAWKNSANPGTLVHVDDALSFFELKFLARILTGQSQLGPTATEDDLLSAVRIYPGTDDFHSKTITDKEEADDITFEVTFGAENAPARIQIFEYTRDQVAASILANLENAIRNMVVQNVGVWRADLVSSLRERLNRGASGFDP
ncbi:MAG TPA: ATP-binding protein [Allosphingosinicella sp.]|jgi:hypothetical protein|nr:ATP-binding protein [Allosphingosinicella sp.]